MSDEVDWSTVDWRSVIYAVLGVALFFWAPRRLLALLGFGYLYHASKDE